jgi:hypothetical protein
MIDEETILARIRELKSASCDQKGLGELYTGTLNLVTMLYGSSSPQVKMVESLNQYQTAWSDVVLRNTVAQLLGVLQSIEAEVQAGLVHSIRAESKGEVLAGFVNMARWAIDDGQKDVAAVLASAALEDSLKQYAERNNLDVDEKSMSEVISALKSQGLVKGTQGKLLQSFTAIRNKAFHADWDKIDDADVKSVIGFVEQFLLTHF